MSVSQRSRQRPAGGQHWLTPAVTAVAIVAVVAATLFEKRLVAAANDPSGAVWAFSMLSATLVLAATSLAWIAVGARELRARAPEIRAMAPTAAVFGAAIVAAAYILHDLIANDYLANFRGRWILCVLLALAALLLARWLERSAPLKQTATLAGISAGAGVLAAIWLWVTIGASGFESFPAYAAVWTVVVLSAAAAWAITTTTTSLAVLRLIPAGRLLEVSRRWTAPELPSGTGMLVGLTLLAAVLRFVTLDAQSFWGDEAFTVWLVRKDLADMLTTLPATESNPPLYYVLAWGWAKVFGTGEVGLRSLSALAGTATVPVVFAAARELTSRRVAVVAAGLVAVHPMLVGYSYGARGYGLFALLGAVSLLFFARSLADPTRRNLLAWALASALAMGTHYFALFLVAPAALWLLVTSSRRRSLALPFAVIAATAGALAPLAFVQASDGANDWIGASPLGDRLYGVVTWFSVGNDGFEETARVVQYTLLALAAWLLLARASLRERRGALLAAGLGAGVVAIPLGLDLTGQHYLLYRNVIVAVPLLAVTVGAGFGGHRAGWAGLLGAIGFSAVSIAVVVASAFDAQRDIVDWRAAAAAVGPPPDRRVGILADAENPARVLKPSAPGPSPLDIYFPRAEAFTGRPASVREVAVVEGGDDLRPPASPLPGFRFVERRSAKQQVVYRFRSERPALVSPRSFSPRRLGRGMSDARLQRAVAPVADRAVQHGVGGA